MKWEKLYYIYLYLLIRKIKTEGMKEKKRRSSWRKNKAIYLYLTPVNVAKGKGKCLKYCVHNS